MRVLWTVLIVSFLLPVANAAADTEMRGQANECQEASDFKCCGDIVLVFRNPDLRPAGDGKIKAAGQLFAQFQAIGADADKITFFGFSFSAAAQEADESICDQEPWAPSGAYVINYRADTDPSDGFFINLQTTLVPDGDYMAAVHGYDANDNEIARAWVLASVDNCDPSPPVERCDSDDYPTQEHIDHDITQPWPIMLPGDGELDPSKNAAPSEATLTLEFAEPLSELRVYINGNLIHDKVNGPQGMTQYPGREWDDDLLPGYGPSGAGGTVAPECSQQPPQTCGTLGEAWYYSATAIDPNDIVRVEAVDLAGNLAKKELHIGSGVGGAITDSAPSLTFTADVLERQVAAGETAIFPVSFQNTGGTTAHPLASSEGPEGWETEWFPAHTPVGPGQESKQELNVKVPTDAVSGIYQVNATIEYDTGGGQTKSQTWEFKVLVGGAAATTGNTTTEGEGEEGKESPAPAALIPVAVGLAAWRARRRQ